MSRQPRLLDLDLWSEYEGLCMRILREALQDLSEQATLGQNETELNRDLYRAIIRASHSAARRGEHPPAVVPEGHNPPDASDEERAAREFKIPDFYWAYIDPNAYDPDHAAKQFVVECKRLTRPHAHYSREYVRSGVTRFVSVNHGYAKGMPSGAMVGYLQDIALDDACGRVNVIAVSESHQPLILTQRVNDDGAEFRHELVRPFPLSPFQLMHVWVRMGATLPSNGTEA